MKLEYHPQFAKHYKKRIKASSSLSRKFSERLALFMQDSKHALLHDHQLVGKLSTFRAFSITGDIRVVYKKEGTILRLYDIGTHNQVY